mgnify:CR=1 FL=1
MNLVVLHSLLTQKFLEKCGIKEEDLVTCRPADLLEPGMDKFKAELADKGFPNASEEDVLSYALFPAVARILHKTYCLKLLKNLVLLTQLMKMFYFTTSMLKLQKKFFAAK